MATVKHTYFVFAMINGQLQIVKKLTAKDGACFMLTDDMIQRGGFVVDWSGKSDAFILAMRAQFDPDHPQYNNGITQAVNPPMPYTRAAVTAAPQKQATVGAAWDFSKLPESERQTVKDAYAANNYKKVQNTLEQYGVFRRACSSCGLNLTTKKWMDWAINSGTI